MFILQLSLVRLEKKIVKPVNARVIFKTKLPRKALKLEFPLASPAMVKTPIQTRQLNFKSMNFMLIYSPALRFGNRRMTNADVGLSRFLRESEVVS